MATRLYFSGSQVPAISPAFGGWTADTGARLKLLSAKQSGEIFAAISGGSLAGVAGFVQFVSDELSAQTIAGTIKAYLRCNSDAEADISPRMLIRVVSNDGTVVRGTLLALGNYGGANFSTAAFQNRIFADGDALSGLAVLAGDRLVIEIGANNPSGGDCFVGFGAPSVTSDLPENESETAALVPWIEFSGDVGFQVVAGGSKNLLLLGVG